MQQRLQHRYFVFVRSILFAVIAAMTTYQHTSFLQSIGLNDVIVSAIYVTASIISVVCIWYLALKKKQSVTYRRHLTFAYCLMAFALTGAASNWGTLLSAVSILFLLCMDSPISFMTDEILEQDTSNAETGKTRSWYLSLQNLVWVVVPVVAYSTVVLHTYNTYISIYTFCIYIALLLIAFQSYVILTGQVIHSKHEYQHLPFVPAVIPAIVAHIMLHTFYVTMITLFPVYLHTILLWEWSQIGIALSIALVAFPVIQIPLGYLFDKNKSIEKICMPLGVSIMSFSLAVLVFSTSMTTGVVILLMFISRIGAAMTEVADETYIFRTINEHHRTTIALFRSVGPMMFCITPLLFLAKNTLGFSVLFGLTAVILFFGSIVVLQLLAKH